MMDAYPLAVQQCAETELRRVATSRRTVPPRRTVERLMELQLGMSAPGDYLLNSGALPELAPSGLVVCAKPRRRG